VELLEKLTLCLGPAGSRAWLSRLMRKGDFGDAEIVACLAPKSFQQAVRWQRQIVGTLGSVA